MNHQTLQWLYNMFWTHGTRRGSNQNQEETVGLQTAALKQARRKSSSGVSIQYLEQAASPESLLKMNFY